MPGRVSQFDQATAMMRVGEVAHHPEPFQEQVRRIVESPAFRGSKRSQLFLRFVVNRALEGRFDDLKERTLGIELFGRDPSYDTDRDAIVRVTACDVRRRLVQFYSTEGEAGGLRIELPPGSYIPDFRSAPPAATPAKAVQMEPVEPLVETEAAATPARKAAPRIASMLVGAAVMSAGWIGLRPLTATRTLESVAPWSAVMQPNRTTHVVFCDPEIVTVQMLLNFNISVSDYANRRFFPGLEQLDPGMRRVMQAFQGTNIAAVDSAIATRVAGLVSADARGRFETHAARSLRLADFKTDDNFILFGSPRSNPWVGLYREQLGFQFESNSLSKAESIRNTRPQVGEAPVYVPTAGGWATGEAYALVALVNNPNQSGHVLILAGSSAESTEAAGKFATNLPLLAQTLDRCHIPTKGTPPAMEILLRVSTMAGSSNTFDVAACHLLPPPSRPGQAAK